MEKSLRELLLKDLCARLPYGVQCKYNRILPIGWELSDPSTDGTLQSIEIETSGSINVKIDGRLHGLSDFKPYLRPMESMTEDERNELSKILNYEFYIDYDFGLVAEDDRHRIRLELCEDYIDWLNERHFDYRGLIPMGLALPAKEGMY